MKKTTIIVICLLLQFVLVSLADTGWNDTWEFDYDHNEVRMNQEYYTVTEGDTFEVIIEAGITDDIAGFVMYNLSWNTNILKVNIVTRNAVIWPTFDWEINSDGTLSAQAGRIGLYETLTGFLNVFVIEFLALNDGQTDIKFINSIYKNGTGSIIAGITVIDFKGNILPLEIHNSSVTVNPKSNGGNGGNDNGGGQPPIPPTNQNPVANAGESFTNFTNRTLTFDGTDSYDTDGEIISYKWDFGDDTIETGMTTEHTYTKPDVYAVVLTVTDDDGATGYDTIYVTVIQEQPEDNETEEPDDKEPTNNETDEPEPDENVTNYTGDVKDEEQPNYLITAIFIIAIIACIIYCYMYYLIKKEK